MHKYSTHFLTFKSFLLNVDCETSNLTNFSCDVLIVKANFGALYVHFTKAYYYMAWLIR